MAACPFQETAFPRQQGKPKLCRAGYKNENAMASQSLMTRSSLPPDSFVASESIVQAASRVDHGT
jgi:hypothetical protein